MLYAVGNNHAGTYFPVVLAVVPFLGEILREGGATARLWALDVLIDLIGSFEPEPGFEIAATSAEDRPLRELLKKRIRGLAGDVERRTVAAESPAELKLAEDLLAGPARVANTARDGGHLRRMSPGGSF